jgi:CheY-like chemotaxis protein
MNALVIDDDDVMRLIVAQMLTVLGYEAKQFEDGMAALAQLETEPSLVVTDVFMPGRDGIEVVREIKRRFPDCPVIAMSGSGGKIAAAYLSFSEQLGADYTLLKPFDLRAMSAIIEKIRARPPSSS